MAIWQYMALPGRTKNAWYSHLLWALQTSFHLGIGFVTYRFTYNRYILMR